MDNKSSPLDIPNKNYNNDIPIKHVCFSYPCYYCNKDVIQNLTTLSCVDKRISFISNSLENSTSSYENKLSTSVDSETQTSLTFIDIEKYEMMSSSMLSNNSNISNNNDNKNENENENENEYENEDTCQNDIFQMDTSDVVFNNLNNINPNDKHIDNHYDKYTYNSKYNNYFDPETFDGHIDSVPDKVFLDIGEALLLEQSVEF